MRYTKDAESRPCCASSQQGRLSVGGLIRSVLAVAGRTAQQRDHQHDGSDQQGEAAEHSGTQQKHRAVRGDKCRKPVGRIVLRRLKGCGGGGQLPIALKGAV